MSETTPSKVGQYSYRTINKWFISACDWLTTLGVKFDNTRITQYSDDLNKIADYYEGGRISELLAQRGFPQLMNSLLEAQEICAIHRGLCNINDSDLSNRLGKIVKGKVLLSEESPKSSHARNISFELLIASACASSGLPIDLEPPNDVWLPLSDHPLAIECKRPFSYAKVETRLRDGFKQLIQRYNNHHENPSNVRGILALSISKIENDGSKFLSAKTEEELNSQTFHIIETFCAKYERHWNSGVDKRTIAVLIHLEAPAIIESPVLLLMNRQLVFVTWCEPNSSDYAFLKRISDAIASVSPLRV